MQKIIQRAKLAERQAKKRADKEFNHKLRGEAWQRGRTQLLIRRDKGERIRQEKVTRKLDWAAGSLAPRRDVGEHAETYGTIPSRVFTPPDRDPAVRPSWHHIREGDRVVMMTGRDRGKIGRVDDTNYDKVAVKVEGLNMLDISIPDWLKQENDLDRNIISQSQFVPLEDVRLVYPLPDPQTGVPRDVIIERLIRVAKPRSEVIDKERDEDTVRVIPGTNTVIPWPEKPEPIIEDHDADTPRLIVDEETFRPFLIRPPMPLSVIDELRNKFSKFRTRHDYDFRMKVEAREAKVEKRKLLIDTMRTPMQELAEYRAEQKKAQEKELTDEQLAKIGEVIAQEQARTAGPAQEEASSQ